MFDVISVCLLDFSAVLCVTITPVNMVDHTGESPANIVFGIIGGVVGAALGVLLAKHLGLSGWKKWALISAATVGGAVLGAFLGPYLAKLAKSIGSTVKTVSKKAVSKKAVFRSRGSTGRTIARNLKEQLAMKQVRSNPLSGARRLNIKMTDKRWLAKDGWVKMSQNVNGIEVHFLYNTIQKVFDDFKFK